MSTYGRTGRSATPATNPAETGGPPPDAIRVNGFQQLVEMLRVADPAFRESLLVRIAQRDQALARSLRQDLSR